MSFDLEDEDASYGVSFPTGFEYGQDEGDGEAAASSEVKPRILLMGLRRSGKSSIQKVVFHKVSPNETLFLESTNKIVKEDVTNSSFVCFQIWDLPGHLDYFDSTFDAENIFGSYGALIFVIDAQDDYMDALQKLHVTVTRVYKINPGIKFEVFIHKVDGLSDDHKIEAQRDIHQRACDDLIDAGLENVHLSFYLTSIYDHSIFEAFSKVVQKLIPQLPTLENLLNILISNSGIEKAFLFDVVSKIYIATDSSPVDMQSYELCCDMIDVVIDVSCIYGEEEYWLGIESNRSQRNAMYVTTHDRSPQYIAVVLHYNKYGWIVLQPMISHLEAIHNLSDRIKVELREGYTCGRDDSIFDTQSSSVIKLNNGTVLYLREVNRYLALVCILRVDSFDRQGLIDYNFLCFQQAIQEVFELRKKSKLPDISQNHMLGNDLQVNGLSTEQNRVHEDSKIANKQASNNWAIN